MKVYRSSRQLSPKERLPLLVVLAQPVVDVQALEQEFDGREVPRPPRWTGLRVRPSRIEFWAGAQFRLHERWLYEGDLAGDWSKRMLYP